MDSTIVGSTTSNIKPHGSMAHSLRRAHEDVALPSRIHQVVHVPMDTRIIVIGDIHGCFDELCDLLQKTQYTPNRDRLVFVGDLINKGPQSCEVVRYARQQNVLCVRGNHDDAALSHYYHWQHTPNEALPPKYDYVQHFSPDDVAFLEQLPFTITLPNQHAIIVHAGLVPGVPLEEQEPINMYKMRWLTRLGDTEQWTASESKPTTDDKEVKPWASMWQGPLHVIFGHDAMRGLQQEEFATGLDTGCCYGRQLTACILPTREIVSVEAHATHAPMTVATHSRHASST